MELSQSDLDALSRVLDLLADDVPAGELRRELGRHLLPLLQADYYASYVWDGARQRYSNGVCLNMDPENLMRYESTYQFISPITGLMQARRKPTIVSEVFPQEELLRTEYFSEFLARDGLHWGMTLHVFDGPRALGDFRIWRGQRRSDFTQREKLLLSLLHPALIRALARRSEGGGSPSRGEQQARLSDRERVVAHLVGSGLTDKEIARRLDISPATVRTYLQRLFEKLGIRRRSALANLLASTDRSELVDGRHMSVPGLQIKS